MHKQTQLPPSNQASMPCQQVGADDEPTDRSLGGAADDAVLRTHIVAEDHLVPSSPPADDFEFCILSSGGLALAGDDAAAADMCVADEVFSGGKLLPLRLSSAASADASSAAALLLLRSDSLDGAATATSSGGSGSSSSSVSRSSSCVSRSTSSNSASSDHASVPRGSSSSSKSASSSAATVPPRRSLSGSVFYAHPSPSPRPPPKRRHSRTTAAPAAARRSTGSAPPASWGVIRLGVVGAPEVYAPRPAAEFRKATAARSGSRSARFELRHKTDSGTADKKLAGLGLLGAGLVCSCSPDAVAPVGSAEVATAEARRRRRKKAEEKKKRSATTTQSGKGSTARRRSRILEWLEELSISKEKIAVSS